MNKRYETPPMESTLIFLHIPKAAGSTLHKIIQRQYPAGDIYHIEGGNVRESIRKLTKLDEDERARIRFLKGHMHFGLHEHLPGHSSYITILRDPIERVISHYYYVKSLPEHYLHEEVTSSSMSLEQYVKSGITREVNDGQTRLISGMEEADETPVFEYGAVPRSALEAAKDNLRQRFIAVGLLERFDETVLLFAKALGWKDLYYRRQNITRDKLESSGHSAKILNTIREYNSLDLELYDFAASMFENMLEENGIGRKELIAFRASNLYKDMYVSLKDMVPQSVKSRIKKR